MIIALQIIFGIIFGIPVLIGAIAACLFIVLSGIGIIGDMYTHKRRMFVRLVRENSRQLINNRKASQWEW